MRLARRGQDIRGETLIAATRTLVHQGVVELLVPQVVIDEYDRNREHVVTKLGQSTRTHVKLAKAALLEHGHNARSQELIDELDEVAVRGPLIEQLVLNRFGEVRDLLEGGRLMESSDDDRRSVIQRGLDKRAPFHSKASVADALLIEMYCSVASKPLTDPADQHGLVTHNLSDFSHPKDNRRRHCCIERSRDRRATNPSARPLSTSRPVPLCRFWQPDGAPSDSPLGGQQEDLLCRCHTTA